VDPNEEFPPREVLADEEPVVAQNLPTLSKRADICTNFPVIVDKISADDVDTVYGVFWHNVNLRALKRASKESEDTIYNRLVAALNASRKTGRWSVEPARRESDLCTLVMRTKAPAAAPAAAPAELVLPEINVHDDATVAGSRPATPATDLAANSTDEWTVVAKPKAVAAAKPIAKTKLTRLNHIKENFPVIWHEVSPKTFAIEIFGKKLKEMGGDRAKITAQLLAALKDSSAWTVKPASNKDEVARIVLA
jgi:hypothetical protein